MLIFRKIRWKNFLSTGNNWTEISLDSHQTSLIVGANGAGKSTILDAITFALYGKPFRNINKPLLINSNNGKDCLVEIEFSTNGKDYKIVRGLKPAIFNIYINDQLLDQNSKTLEYQDYLTNSILKMTMKSFTQIVILGSASFVPFMQLTPADRRGVIEDLLDIQIFTIMNVLAKQKLLSNKEDYNSLSIKLKMLDEMVALIERNLVIFRQNQSDKISGLMDEKSEQEKMIDETETELSRLHKKVLDLAVEKNSIDKLREKHRQLIALHTQLTVKHEKHNKDIDFYENNDHCPVCLQELAKDFKDMSVKSLNAKVDELESAISSLSGKISDVVDQIAKLTDVIEEWRSVKTVIEVKESLLKTYQDNLNSLTTQLSSFEENNNLIVENETNLADKIEERQHLTQAKQDNLVERQYLDVAIQLLKDSGIKAKIIKQYLPIINKNINKYLSQMGFFVDFHIDETFKETIKSRFRDEFSYENFSEGEKMRIDLSILFSWRTIARMRNSVNTNLLILDEIFDSSLDSNGVDDFLKIMADKSDTTNIFVISHKTDALLDKFDRIIRFEKYKSYSRIAKDINENE